MPLGTGLMDTFRGAVLWASGQSWDRRWAQVNNHTGSDMEESLKDVRQRAVLLFRPRGVPIAATEGLKPVAGFVQVVRLSRKEIEVLTWLSKGKRYQDVSDITGMTVPSIYAHAHRIMNKLGASTTAGAVGIALRQRIIE